MSPVRSRLWPLRSVARSAQIDGKVQDIESWAFLFAGRQFGLVSLLKSSRGAGQNEGMDVSNLARIFRENVNRILAEKQISRNELARLTGMHQPTVVKMLNGENEIQTNTIERIAAALEVDAIELMQEVASV